MDTLKITLEQISRDYFANLYSHWYRTPIPYSDITLVHALITNPLIYENYESLIKKFLDHPNAYELNFLQSGTLQRVRRRNIEERGLQDIVYAIDASRENRVLVRLRRGARRKGNYFAKIAFTELSGKIVSFNVRSTPRFANDFILKKISKTCHFRGLLDPNFKLPT